MQEMQFGIPETSFQKLCTIPSCGLWVIKLTYETLHYQNFAFLWKKNFSGKRSFATEQKINK